MAKHQGESSLFPASVLRLTHPLSGGCTAAGKGLHSPVFRIRYQCNRITPIDFVSEANRLADLIKQYNID